MPGGNKKVTPGINVLSLRYLHMTGFTVKISILPFLVNIQTVVGLKYSNHQMDNT